MSSKDSSVRSSESFESALNLYSIAAAVAGVSVLAMAKPAAGEIVITNTHTPVPLCLIANPCPVSIDLNKDGINDFQFQLSSTPLHYNFAEYFRVAGLKGGAVMGSAGGIHESYASCLLRSAKIGGSAHFKAAPLIERSSGFSFQGSYSRHLFGNWGGSHPNRFLGVKFKIKGAIHYGWIRVTVNSTGRISATITEYGYETIANKTVKAGLTGTAADGVAAEDSPPQRATSLGMLAAGADGLVLWRREETAVQ